MQNAQLLVNRGENRADSKQRMIRILLDKSDKSQAFHSSTVRQFETINKQTFHL